MDMREAPRVSMEFKVLCSIDKSQNVYIRFLEGNFFETQAIDISEKGIRVLSKYLLPRGLILDLDMEGWVFGLDRNIKVRGEVRCCETLEWLRGKNRVGIMFLDLSEEDRAAIVQFINSHQQH